MRTRFWALLAATLTSAGALAQDGPVPRVTMPTEPGEPTPLRASSAGPSAANMMKKMATPEPQSGLYGLVDLRHTTNDYFDDSGRRLKRDPALHAKLRIGARFYRDTLDVSAGFGGTKLPASQRVYQNRPEVTLDVYPLRGRVFNFMIYANAMFPVRADDMDPTEFSDGDRYDQDYRRGFDATVMSAGVAPNLKVEASSTMGRAFLMLGADAWTRLYSKPLYIAENDGSRDLGLLAEKTSDPEKPFEDRAMRYVHQEMAGIGYTPSILPKFQIELAGYYESRYLPEYTKNTQSGAWDYTYKPERVSFTRWKASYDFTPSASLSNEFYYLRNGFFSEDRINEERRFKNIVRLAFKL